MSQDLRLSLRSFRQHPGFTVLATLIVALGAGANAAVFAVMHEVLLRPLPYERPGQLVAIVPASFVTAADVQFLQSTSLFI